MPKTPSRKRPAFPASTSRNLKETRFTDHSPLHPTETGASTRASEREATAEGTRCPPPPGGSSCCALEPHRFVPKIWHLGSYGKSPTKNKEQQLENGQWEEINHQASNQSTDQAEPKLGNQSNPLPLDPRTPLPGNPLESPSLDASKCLPRQMLCGPCGGRI